MMHQLTGTAYGDVYEVLDDLRVADAVSVGSLRKVHAAIDELRAMGAPDAQVVIAEKIAVAMYRLEAARRRKDKAAEEDTRNRLDGLVADWIDKRLCTPSQPSNDDCTGSAEHAAVEDERPIPTITQAGRFVQFRRSDGSGVACQVSRVLYVAKGEHGAILQFGNGAQLNLRNSFEEVLYRLEAE